MAEKFVCDARAWPLAAAVWPTPFAGKFLVPPLKNCPRPWRSRAGANDDGRFEGNRLVRNRCCGMVARKYPRANCAVAVRAFAAKPIRERAFVPLFRACKSHCGFYQATQDRVRVAILAGTWLRD